MVSLGDKPKKRFAGTWKRLNRFGEPELASNLTRAVRANIAEVTTALAKRRLSRNFFFSTKVKDVKGESLN